MGKCLFTDKIQGNLKEVWSNPNPQDSFMSDTTINVPINDVMLIEFCYSTTQNSLKCTFLLNADSDTFAIPDVSDNSFVSRGAEKLENGISFGQGIRYSGRFISKDDLYMIPNKIYTL